MAVRRIIIAEVEFIAYTLAREKLSFDEPIPEFSSRFPNVLESCLAVPFQRFANRTPYPGLTGKAAMLFYLMVKNHPFQNGNKRIAMTTLLVFLHRNSRWLTVDARELYEFAKFVAISNPKLKTEMVKTIEKFVTLHLERI